jgi:Ca2+-binding RTX toxin-like protein
MAITAAVRQDIMELAVLMNNSAPGTTLLAELVAKSTAGSSLTEIAEHLAGRAEFTAKYPTFQTANEFASEWLANALPEASADLLAECVTIVEAHINGGGSIPALVVSVQAFMTDAANATGGLKTHIDNFTNKVAVATYHTITKEAAAEWDIPASVSSDAATVATAKGSVDTATAPAAAQAQTMALTVGVDNAKGGSGDDLILATVDETTVANNTFSTADVIDGGEGSDTLQLAVSATATDRAYNPALISNTETFRIVNTSANNADVNLTTVAGLTGVEVSSSAQNVDITNITDSTTKLMATANTGTGVETVSFAFKAAALLGTATDVDLTLTSNSGDVAVQTNGAGIESMTITAIGVNTAGRYVGAAADLETLTVKGTGSLAVNVADMAAVTTLDATGNSGGVTYNATASNATLKGGTGNDVLTDGAGNDVITGGAGNDTLTGGASNDNIDGGAGDDQIVLSAVTKDDTVTGGEGTDTLSLAAGTTYSATVSAGSGVSGFEVISNTGGATMTQNLSGLGTNAITTLSLGGGTGTATIQEAAITTVDTEDMGATGGAVLGLKTDGTADTLAVNIGAAGGTRGLTLAAVDYETLNIVSTGTDGNSVTLNDTDASYLATGATEIAARTAALAAKTVTDLTTVNITGNKNLTVTDSAESTAVTTVNAADFTGATLNVNFNDSNAAITATANTGTSATITTGDGADTVTVGNGGTALTNNITTGKGNDTITSGAGADTINAGAGANKITSGDGDDILTGGDGADTIDGGEGNDNITSAKGADSITAGAGNDTVTTTDDNDTVIGGTGDDNITTNKGNDSVVAGDGNDTIVSGTGSDYVSGGTGNDNITVGTGDDTVDGGTGNDTITVQTLSNGDSLVGGDGTDTLTIAAISSTSTPKNISGMEVVNVTSLGGGAVGITLDLTNVTGLTSLTSANNTTGAVTMNINNAPSTLTALSLDDGGNASDTLAITYSAGPSALTFDAFDVTNAATNITSLNAPLTINGKVATTQAGVGQAYAAGNVSSLGTMTTDASTITLTTDALDVGQAGATNSLTIGAITDSVLEGFSLTTGANSNASVSSGNLTTTNTEFTSYKVDAGASSIVTLGEVVADSASGSVSVDIDAAASSAITLGNADSTFDAAAVTIDINLGDQSSITTGGVANNIVGNTIVSTNIVAGAGVGTTGAHVTVPGPEVDAVTGTIGATTISAGILSYIDTTTSSGTAAADVGAITASGGGHIKVTLGATNAATYTPSGGTARSSQGDVSGAAMTSPLSSLTVVGTAAVGAFALTGGAGNDALTGGGGKDTITGGKGVDSITSGVDADIIIFNDGDSDPVYSNVKQTSTGQDTIADNGTGAANQILQFNITSRDTTWVDTTHIMVGTATGSDIGSATEGNTAAFKAKTVLVQTGTHAAVNTSNTDPQDIVINVNSALTAGQAQAMSQVNLTGTSGADTLTTGALQDTIDGGAGNDTVDAGVGADRIVVSLGDDTVTIPHSDGVANTASTLANPIAVGNTVTFANGVDTIVGFEAGTGGDVLDLTNAGATLATGIGENSGALTASKTLFLSGAYVSSTGVFTVAADGTGADTLLMQSDDANVSATAADSWILLVGVDSDNLVAANII